MISIWRAVSSPRTEGNAGPADRKAKGKAMEALI